MKSSIEFVVGKHNIGYVSTDFNKYFKDAEFEKKEAPTFQKLPRRMNDAAIESELKPGICDLGDVLAFIDNPPEECKDGYWNLFYTPAFVVRVFWLGDEWYMDAWVRGDDGWSDDGRVFSPATVNFETSTLDPLNTLTLEKAVEMVKEAGYRVYKEVEI